MDTVTPPAGDECRRKFLDILTGSLHHYLQLLTVPQRGEIEFELRFHSWRAPIATRPPNDGAVTWDRYLTYDEMRFVSKTLQSLGWKPRESAQRLQRHRLLSNPRHRIDEHNRLIEKKRLTTTSFDNTRRTLTDTFLTWFHTTCQVHLETVLAETHTIALDQCEPRTLERLALYHDALPWVRIDCSQCLETHKFELEVELRNDHVRGLEVEYLATQLWQLQCQLLSALQRSFCPIFGAEWSSLQYQWQTQLLTAICFPQPISVRMDHLQSIHQGDFAITQKIDGSREQLWFVNRRSYRVETSRDYCRIAHTGWKVGTGEFEAQSLVADLECVFEPGAATTPAHYALHLFDLLWYNGHACAWNLPKRLETLSRWYHHAFDVCPPPPTVVILLKPYVIMNPDTQLSMVARQVAFYQMLQRFVDVEYPVQAGKIDGYILTALNVPLPAAHSGIRGLQTKRWAGAVKWKPIPLTTIDFQLGDFDETRRRCKLLVWDNTRAVDFVTSLDEASWLTFPEHMPFFGNRALYVVGGGNGGDSAATTSFTLRAGQIVECSWHCMRWFPIRVRGDKQVPNAVDVAHANWQLIQYPVPLPRTPEEASQYIREDARAYYDDGVLAADDVLIPIRRLHNRIKQEFIQWVIRRIRGSAVTMPVSVLDFAFGRGGDIQKYVRAGASLVLGLDLNAGNLQQAEHRLRELMVNDQLATVFHLLELNVGKTWVHERGGAPTYLYSTDASVLMRSTLMSNLLSCGRPMFDVGTMLFALHFLWQTSEVLDMWIQHVAETIKVDGYLLVAGFDGRRVHEYFRKQGTKEFVFGNQVHDRIWSVTPVYDLAAPYDATHCFGFGLDVYVQSVHHRLVHREYLVHPEELSARLARVGFREIAMDGVAGYSFQEYPWTKDPEYAAIPLALQTTINQWNRMWVFHRHQLGVPRS